MQARLYSLQEIPKKVANEYLVSQEMMKMSSKDTSKVIAEESANIEKQWGVMLGDVETKTDKSVKNINTSLNNIDSPIEDPIEPSIEEKPHQKTLNAGDKRGQAERERRAKTAADFTARERAAGFGPGSKNVPQPQSFNKTKMQSSDQIIKQKITEAAASLKTIEKEMTQ